MKSIQMVDLKSQYTAIKQEIDQAIAEVIQATAFINGPQVKIFAEELAAYNQVKHVIPCANGTDALQIAMMALNLRPGDEVIVPSFTYVATVEVIALLNLKPVFVDVNKNTFNIAVSEIEQKITAKTKAIVPVHLFGQCADMENIINIAHKHKLFIIEDTAQAIGSTYRFSDGTFKKAGTIGHIGATSFFPSKNLGCFGDGGALLTNDSSLAQKMQMIANHGQKEKYYHDSIGVNSRLDTLQAAILSVKLKKLDDYNARRKAVADFYDIAFADMNELQCPFRSTFSDHVFHQYTLKTRGINRDDLKAYLQSKGIPSMIYYPVPLHLQKAYTNYGYKKGDFPVAEELCASVISLPIHTEMKEDQLNYITSSVKEFVHSK